MYHNAFMERWRLQEQGEPLEPHESMMLSRLSVEGDVKEQTKEQQNETTRHLKPHSRSTIQLQNIIKEPITQHDSGSVAGDPKSKTKHKSTKWQFGIRSRNEPVDAIKCLYRALTLMGDCQWQVSPPTDPSQSTSSKTGPFPVDVKGATHLPQASHNLSESPEKERVHHLRRQSTSTPPPDDIAETPNSPPLSPSQHHPYGSEAIDDDDDEDIDPTQLPENYAPRDPWCIHVRWEKRGMHPPGLPNSVSAQSSAIDLNSASAMSSSTIVSQPLAHDPARRSSLAPKHESTATLGSAAGSTTSVLGHGHDGAVNADTACFVYLDLQIYVLEPEVYLVDFKNAGYEPIIGEVQDGDGDGDGGNEGQRKRRAIGSGKRKGDKDVTSPQPFLDLANKLVINLAKGAGG